MPVTTATQPQNIQQYEADCREFVNGFKSDNPRTIVQHIRSRNRRKIGVIVAFRGMQGEIRAGFSLCNVKKERRGFNSLIGLRKAIQRSLPVDEIDFEICYRSDDPGTHNGVPQGARRTMLAVCDRARKYFSDE